MKLTKDEAQLLYSKLEYRFKNSGHELVAKLKECKDLTETDLEMLEKKLEFRFRNSGLSLIHI